MLDTHDPGKLPGSRVSAAGLPAQRQVLPRLTPAAVHSSAQKRVDLRRELGGVPEEDPWPAFSWIGSWTSRRLDARGLPWRTARNDSPARSVSAIPRMASSAAGPGAASAISASRTSGSKCGGRRAARSGVPAVAGDDADSASVLVMLPGM